jgi:hypothetical protein
MSHNISIEGGTPVRLPTAGKYCDRDIIVSPENLNEKLAQQDALIEQIKTALQDKSVGGTVEITLQEKSVIPTEAAQEIVADNGYDGLSKVSVGAIPDEYIIPNGSKAITENGVHSVTEYASVQVDVPIPDGYIKPSGVKNITENGTHDVKVYESVVVDVPTSSVADPSKEYQRVEYIESAEEETYPYIITDVYADNSCGVEVVASFPKLQDRIPMGSRQNSDATRFYCVYPMSASSVYYGFNAGSSISCALKVDTIYRLQTNFLNSRLVNVYDELGIRKASASLSATLSKHPVPIAIFGYNSGTSGDVTSKREFKLYRARISNDYEVIRDYVPCYRKSDGVVGLYEKVTGQFLENSASTGSFAKGKDVEW